MIRPLANFAQVSPPAAPPQTPAVVVRDLYQGGTGGLDARELGRMRRVLESMLHVTGDAQDGQDDAAFILSSTRAEEKVTAVADKFQRLLIAADGMRSDSVRALFTAARAAKDPDEALDRAVALTDACGRNAARALVHFATASALDDKTLQRYLEVARCADAATDSALESTVSQWIQAGTAAAETPRLDVLARSSRNAALALADLTLARSMRDVDSAIASIVDLRGRGVSDAAELQAGVTASGGDHHRTFLTLLEVERDAQAASEAVGWIVANTPAGASEKASLQRYVALRRRLPEQRRAAVKTLFEQLQARVSAEPQGLCGRLLGRAHPAERAVFRLLAVDHDPERAVRHLEAVEAGRQPDESLADALSRYRHLLYMDELDDPDAAQEAFKLVSRALPHDDPGPKARLARYQDMAVRMGSIRNASEAWAVVADASTHTEFSAREQILKNLLEREADRNDAAALFKAAAVGVGPSDSMTSAMGLLEEYRAKMGPALAPQAWTTIMSWRGLPGNPCPTLEQHVRFFGDLYAQAPTAGGFAAIDQRLQRPLGAESVFTRATVLRGLLVNFRDNAAALREYDWMSTALGAIPGESFETLAEAYAVFAGSAKRGPDADPHTVLAWLLNEKKTNPFFKDARVDEMMHKMAALMVLSRDIDSAKMNFVKRETPAGTVEKGEEEVVIGGIRVPRKKESGGTA